MVDKNKKPKKTEKEKWQKRKRESDKALEQEMLKDWFKSDKPAKRTRPSRHIKTTVGGKVVRVNGKEVKEKS
jgi:hypothetical protein